MDQGEKTCVSTQSGAVPLELCRVGSTAQSCITIFSEPAASGRSTGRNHNGRC
jgi:hypothetical protein